MEWAGGPSRTPPPHIIGLEKSPKSISSPTAEVGGGGGVVAFLSLGTRGQFLPRTPLDATLTKVPQR